MRQSILRRFPRLAGVINRVAFRPAYQETIDLDLLVTQAAEFLNLPSSVIETHLAAYRRLHEQKQYAQQLGERKTLSFEEAFLLYLAIAYLRPRRIVEIGTYEGKSTRRILDSVAALGLDTEVICFDIVDHVKYFAKEEASLRLHDLTPDFETVVLESLRPELIFLDARPYHLLAAVIGQFVAWPGSARAVLAIHDCTPGLFNPRMRVDPNDPAAVTSRTGVWERHVLANVFDASQADLDRAETGTHRLRIFHTPHGLALIAAKEWLRSLEKPNGR
jgi:hypothetical protein